MLSILKYTNRSFILALAIFISIINNGKVFAINIVIGDEDDSFHDVTCASLTTTTTSQSITTTCELLSDLNNYESDIYISGLDDKPPTITAIDSFIGADSLTYTDLVISAVDSNTMTSSMIFIEHTFDWPDMEETNGFSEIEGSFEEFEPDAIGIDVKSNIAGVSLPDMSFISTESSTFNDQVSEEGIVKMGSYDMEVIINANIVGGGEILIPDSGKLIRTPIPESTSPMSLMALASLGVVLTLKRKI